MVPVANGRERHWAARCLRSWFRDPLPTESGTPGSGHVRTQRSTHHAQQLLSMFRAHMLSTGEWPVLSDLGYVGEPEVCTTAIKKPAGGSLAEEQKEANKAHNSRGTVGERGNSLLKSTFKVLRRVSLCPYRIGAIVAAALVLLHIKHHEPPDHDTPLLGKAHCVLERHRSCGTQEFRSCSGHTSRTTRWSDSGS